MNAELNAHGLALMREFDLVGALALVICSMLVCVSELDPIAPPGAAREIVAASAEEGSQIEVIAGRPLSLERHARSPLAAARGVRVLA